MQSEKKGMAIASMILGIIGLLLSVVGIGLFPAIAALILGIIVIVKKRFGRRMAITGIAAATVGIALVIIILIIVTANSGTKESAKKDTIESNVTNDPGQSATQEPSKILNTQEDKIDESEASRSDNTFQVGESLELKDERLTYLSCDENYTPDNQFAQPKSGNKIVRLEFEYDNIGQIDRSISFYSFTGYADGYKVDPWYYADDDINGTISSGKKVKGAVYFEVPKDAKEITVEYDMNLWTSKKAIFLVK